MKKIILLQLLTSAFIFLQAQISLESTYNFSGTYTRLSNSGYKFYLMDVGTSQCRIYNTNHTLWKTINLTVPAGNYLYDIRYVSENLFTNDNSLCLAYIYYSYNATGQYYTYNARIVKENGTELLSIPGCQYIYVHNLEGIGTKMIAYCYDYSVSPYTIQSKVYNLPGQLVYAPAEVSEPNPAQALAFPNPAGDYTTITYFLPSGINSAELKLTDLRGITIRTWKVEAPSGSISLNTAGFPGGIYFYSLNAESYKSENFKLIIK